MEEGETLENVPAYVTGNSWYVLAFVEFFTEKETLLIDWSTSIFLIQNSILSFKVKFQFNYKFYLVILKSIIFWRLSLYWIYTEMDFQTKLGQQRYFSFLGIFGSEISFIYTRAPM